MGKDNVPFHTVIFPSTLLGTQASDWGGASAGRCDMVVCCGPVSMLCCRTSSCSAIGPRWCWVPTSRCPTARNDCLAPSALCVPQEPWTMMKSISVTEYLNYEDGAHSFATAAAAAAVWWSQLAGLQPLSCCRRRHRSC